MIIGVVEAECALGEGMRLPSPSRSPGEQPPGDSRRPDQILTPSDKYLDLVTIFIENKYSPRLNIRNKN